MTLRAMAVADAEEVLKIILWLYAWYQDVAVLIDFVWIYWGEAHSSSKCIFGDYILLDVSEWIETL